MQTELHNVEYKRELIPELEREVVAYLNCHLGGTIFIGVNNDGSIYGVKNVDQTAQTIKNRLRDNVRPSCLGLFDVLTLEENGKYYIRLDVASGLEKPYYLRKLGMCPEGCPIRIGTAIESLSQEQIERLYARRIRNSLHDMLSPRDDLTFTDLKIYYSGRGIVLNDSFLKTLEFLTSDGKLNYAAYLMADENGNSVKFAKYAGTDRATLIENDDYGQCSLVKSFYQLETRLKGENKTFAKITFGRRLERKLVDEEALREAVLNALLHNEYAYGGTPKVEMFDDRIEVTSSGSLPPGVTREDFLAGTSSPRNKELMRIFHDLDIVESLGSGLPRILKKYPESVIDIRESYIRLTFPFAKGYRQTNDSEIADDGNLGSQSLASNVEGRDKEVGINANSTAEGRDKKVGINANLTAEGRDKKVGINANPTAEGRDIKVGIKKASSKDVGKTAERLLELLKEYPRMTIPAVANVLGIVPRVAERYVRNLKKEGKLKRNGSRKTGFWQVVD